MWIWSWKNKELDSERGVVGVAVTIYESAAVWNTFGFETLPIYGYGDWNDPVTLNMSEFHKRKPSAPLTVPKKIIVPNGQRKLILK